MYDIVIHDVHVVTVDSKRRIIPGGTVCIKNGKIVYVGKRGEVSTLKRNAKEFIDGSNKVVMPGVINCHTHVYQALIEGIGYDMHFSPWNIRYLLPIVSHLTPEYAELSASLAALEMIRSGTTTVSDHWYLHTNFENIYRVAESFDRAGLRLHSVFGFLNESFAGMKKRSGEEMVRGENSLLSAAREYVKLWHGRNRTIVALGPGSTEDVSRDMFVEIVELGRELGVALVTHIAGWIEIVSRSLINYGMRDLEYAASLGFTGDKSIAIHAVWLSREEIKLLASTATAVVHNPIANMHLGYGIAPVPEMLSDGVIVGLGTDGAASYTYDMFEVGKTAAMLHKVSNLNAEALTAEKVIEMLTIDGARVLGMDGIIGSIEEGKAADLILLDFDKPELMLSGRVVPKILYSARGSDVATTIVDGRILMRDRVVLSVDERRILARAKVAFENLVELGGRETRSLIEAPWAGAERGFWRFGGDG